VLVLGVLPLRSYALLEEVVVGLEAQLGGWRDVVLNIRPISICRAVFDIPGEVSDRGVCSTYVDAPELLDGAECDDLLQQIIPVVALDGGKVST
jgi:hypothetical protein